MAGQGAFRAVATLTAALATISAAAQQPTGVADFLSVIGGDTDMRTSRSLRTRPSPQVYPLLDDGPEIIGYRFFSEKLTANDSATAERARAAFVQECTTKGGRIEPDESEVARTFRDRVLGRRLPPRGEFKHLWRGISAVCSHASGQVLGGFVAIIYGTTGVGTRGDLGSRLLSRVATVPTRTAVYAYSPGLIRSATSLQAQQASVTADREAEQRRRDAFRGRPRDRDRDELRNRHPDTRTDGRDRGAAHQAYAQRPVSLLVETGGASAASIDALHLRPLIPHLGRFAGRPSFQGEPLWTSI